MYTQGELITWGRQQKDFTYLEAVREFVSLILNFDTAKEPFKDVRVRRALVHAINREVVASVSTSGGLPVAFQTFDEKSRWYCANVMPTEFSPGKARELLKQYGKPTPPIEITTIVGQSNRASQIIQSMWRDVGVEATIKVEPTAGALFRDLARGATQASVAIAGPTIHPTVFEMNLASSNPFNLWHIKSARIDSAIDKLHKARSIDEVKVAHCELEQAKVDETPLAYLSYGRIGIFSKKNVGGLVPPSAPWFRLHRLYRIKA
jgi:ABC-type transport system substrate-binding protein